MFQKATREQAKLRLALEGPAGFGKSLTALLVARGLVGPEGRIAAVCTENGSLAKYAPAPGVQADNISTVDFDLSVMEPPFDPRRLVEAIRFAEGEGYDAFVADSLSHFWQGKGGLLEIVDEIARKSYRGDTHRAWKDATPIQQDLTESILRSRVHVIASMRTKTEFVRETVTRDGRERTEIRKAGAKVVQRDEFDYEFDLVGRFNDPAILTISKTRVFALPVGTSIEKPGFTGPGATADGQAFVETLRTWLSEGDSVEPTDEQKARLAAALKKGADVDAERFTLAKVEATSAARFGRALDSLVRREYEKVVESIEKAADAVVAAAEQAKKDAPAEAAE